VRSATARALGRINLIGEHTDYNDGLVMPLALRLGVTVGARDRDDERVTLSTDADVQPGRLTYLLGAEERDGTWADRVKGVTAVLAREGARLRGFDAAITSDLPLGAGLGSSAALAVAVLRAIDDLFALGLDDDAIVRLAHSAETDFAGARAGLLDQLASVYGRQREALLIDVRERTTTVLPFPASAEIAVIDSGVRHEHATGGYNQRRAECEAAARHLGVSSLRDLEERPIDLLLERLPPPLDRRVRHVLTENGRVRETVAALESGDVERVGGILTASHDSLRDDYEVSTAELDRLVELSIAAGAFGARVVGGGFGGSIIALGTSGEMHDVAEQVLSAYGAGGLVAIVP
jgi:galactokinase